MKINEFATLERGQRIEVAIRYPRKPFTVEVMAVCSEPRDGNTMIDALQESTGKVYGIYFRDVIRLEVK